MPTANKCEPNSVQKIMPNFSTYVHDDPASIIAPFEILLDEESNHDFLRDAIKYIASYYNF